MVLGLVVEVLFDGPFTALAPFVTMLSVAFALACRIALVET